MIDLRSDTVTRPTLGMLEYMMEAEVGDDVFAEDPTTNQFEEKIAEMFGMEAGLFVPSGTMGNQLCLQVLTNPGDEIIIDHLGHIFNYETGAAAHLSSVQLWPLIGNRGKLDTGMIEGALRPNNDWDPKSRVVAIENTTNKGGGACYTKKELLAIRQVADKHGLAVHLDGARIWNAMAASGIESEFFGTVADTLLVCFSKSLGAPVGSMILASRENIQKARRVRKMWGGGMRQTGLLTAAAEYAVRYHQDYLQNDHDHARRFAKAVSDMPEFDIDLSEVETNIVLFTVKKGSVETFLNHLSRHSVGMTQFGENTVRAVFHFQISMDEINFVLEIMRNY
ncbi:MAG TPA: GntG family PLP-dependent aldolase [Balneolaceae bacterium]|nr:GntG family PLP-dependent aldolase [Balneolaceae bacterium]